MQTENLSTREKILQAATELIVDKGFKETTTKDIAASAGVSEMSVFRHFGSKKAILVAIMKQYSFEYPIENGLREQLIWELEHDLLLLAEMQYHFNLRNEKAILIRFKESKNLLACDIDVKRDPSLLKEFLVWYFDEMYARGKILKANNEKLAIHFMSFNFGLFCNKMLDVYGPISAISKKEEIIFGATCFARGIQPHHF
ncbi:TetR/AcrR family transcriptional regulator [Sporomusa sp. KB1]|jgi:AcrR family transcriptional regulator|uniref:TetR/AcrR family transcriptional regulator n=1 Tax=Sporomusa sp. KB1 TaxID=943346 RepID=UPI0011AD8AA5|nr:TetR/AcrR family transcriptional regulator [Sporomusa sp. KB1]TWH48460.1 TetR family transcriptional regulator [Sporomusa sp. KB1]